MCSPSARYDAGAVPRLHKWKRRPHDDISAQRFATKTRTWLLIAALTQFVARPGRVTGASRRERFGLSR
jgi:hypothetical protein